MDTHFMLYLPDRLETDRLLIQRLKYEDAEEIFYAYASKLDATRYVSWLMHQSVSDTNKYLRYAIPAWQVGLDYSFSIRQKTDNRLIGSIGTVNDKGKLQFGYIISPTCWNMGYATEACIKLLENLRQLDGAYRIWTFVDVENEASSKVLLKAGLIEEARLAKWYRFVNQGDQPKDCILYRLPL
ncbi:MAG: GNAT family N-acetyltransferase [Cyclobacteriaceae bacterium]